MISKRMTLVDETVAFRETFRLFSE